MELELDLDALQQLPAEENQAGRCSYTCAATCPATCGVTGA
ncbi:ALQxL family class IV lanthipeptide [Kitasatospora sp. NPDC004240]